MKNILLTISLFALIVSCVNTEKLLKEGKYDAATQSALKKIRKGGKKTDEQILVLEQAYKKAMQQDKEKIEYLKKEGNPANYNDIYDLYTKMSNRQELIRPLHPIYIASKQRNADIELIDFSSEIISFKNKACEYHYARAMQSLDKQDRHCAREAYDDLVYVKSLNSNFKDVDDQIKRAKAAGMTYVLYTIENSTPTELPPNFENELLNVPLAELNNNWTVYHNNKNTSVNYNYNAVINIKGIQIGPDALTKDEHIETKEVEDGWNYVLDAKGNVKKDTNGNDIKTKKYKTISCKVADVHQQKKIMVNATLDIFNKSGQLLKTEPMIAETAFENHATSAIGDLNALKGETKNRLNSSIVPFPSTYDMVMRACAPLKGNAKNILWNNKYIFN